jgi:hypothetical protein
MKNVRSQVNIMVWDKVWDEVRDTIRKKISYLVHDQVSKQVYLKTKEQLVIKVRQNIKL